MFNVLRTARCVSSSILKAGPVSSFGCRFNSSGGVTLPNRNKGIPQSHLAALRFRARVGKKRTSPGKDDWSVVGYSTANSFDMLGLQDGLQEQLIYKEISLVDELCGQCIYVTNQYHTEADVQSKDIFFFKDGNVVFWNVPELERNSVLKFLANYTVEEYEQDMIYDESEMMNYTLCDAQTASLEKGLIRINPSSPSYVLSKYTFSNAIASSVKLGAWEFTLEKIIDSIEHISEDLKKNANVKLTRDEVLQKTGEILALRHVINLSGDLLDTPDFYWDREALENLYLATCNHLAVGKRTKIVNEKLSHCLELMDLISTHLSTEHGARLEWIIIILIAIEICFEALHLVERKFGGFAFLDPKE